MAETSTFEYFAMYYFVVYNTPTAKLFIGLVQLWMVTELALRLNTCITLAQNHRAKVTFTNQVLV